MAAPLSTCTVEEQRSVIRFLWSEGVKPSEIYRRMKVQYGAIGLSLVWTYERTFAAQKFAHDDEVMEAVQSWLKATPKSFFLEGIRKLVDRWTKCVAKQGTMSRNKKQTISVNTLVKKVITSTKFPVI